MSYVMSAKMYWNYIDKGMTHDELIRYLNWSFGLRGTITELRITKGN